MFLLNNAKWKMIKTSLRQVVFFCDLARILTKTEIDQKSFLESQTSMLSECVLRNINNNWKFKTDRNQTFLPRDTQLKNDQMSIFLMTSDDLWLIDLAWQKSKVNWVRLWKYKSLFKDQNWSKPKVSTYKRTMKNDSSISTVFKWIFLQWLGTVFGQNRNTNLAGLFSKPTVKS